MLTCFRLLLTWIAHSDRVGITAMHIAIAIVFLWIGALKFAPYEADGFTAFVANSPVMSFFYKHPTECKAHLTREGELNPADRAWQTANDTYTFSTGLGTVGLLTLVGLVSRPWGAPRCHAGVPDALRNPVVPRHDTGGMGAGAWPHPTRVSLPLECRTARAKDVLLLAGAWLVMADSARALLATWVSAAPSRGRTESRLQVQP
jgi:reactive chlorine resistance protein C